MAKPYSLDLRQKVVDAIELDGMKKSEASVAFGISRNTIDLWLKRKAATGSVAPQVNSRARRQRRITDWDGFRAFAEQHRDKTQAEMAECWPGQMSQRTISRALDIINWTRKKTYGYRQRDEQTRQAFVARVPEPIARHLVYVDESGMDERDAYGYGYAPAGERCYDLKSGRRSGRVNMIAGYRGHQLIAPFTVEGACNRTVFETWLETCLIPELCPGDWVVLDNATFHHGGRIAELIESAGCEVVYLPPYSPDLNRIEKCWGWLKSRIRKALPHDDGLRAAIEAVLKQAAS
ncbi:IS630 family transposase [Leptolyngbya sp. CCNP1308]|uniref:IS630 family transposase n=1 Tax=Leptolyngbya sp. CCNP1308 TaxID=3110255 RepID=UPI002B21AA77|nr:IS630 family transposase [Leptolyngbya sp. CCNP1308]MEA5449734.1 IS630 family transposase [Leptolyngbya sp. CCNP1308]